MIKIVNNFSFMECFLGNKSYVKLLIYFSLVLFFFILLLNLSIDLYVVMWLISIYLFDLCYNFFLIFSFGFWVYFFLCLKILCNLINEFCFLWNVIKGVGI